MKKHIKILAVLIVSALLTSDASATGLYYLFSDFTRIDSEFKGGEDVDSYGNRIYVNRDGEHVDVYEIELQDSDTDGRREPHQHPDNPEHTGTMENRTLKHITTYNVPDIGWTGSSEIYAESDRIFFITDNDGISEYIFDSGEVNRVIEGWTNHSELPPDWPWLPPWMTPDPRYPFPTLPLIPPSGWMNISHLGRGSDGTWYASNESSNVYTWDGNEWEHQFQWDDFPGGGHGDGMEVVTDQRTGIDYVYVSDMLADYIGQYMFGDHDDDTATEDQWFELNRFEYPGGGSSISVEGMGFGAMDHFWATSGSHLYEFGAGGLGEYVEPVPEPSTYILLGCGLLGFIGVRKRIGRC